MINYTIYPIHIPSGKEYASLVKMCTDQLDYQGFVSLKNFLKPQHVDALISSLLVLERKGVGFYSSERHNVFLDEIDSSSVSAMNEDSRSHPRHIQLKSSKLLISAKDLAPHTSHLENLFQSRSFLNFIRDILQVTVYPSSDEYGKYYANIFHEGDGLNFHFDRSEFSISLILQPADEGGNFQFVPDSKQYVEEWQEIPLNLADLQAALDASSTNNSVVHEPKLAAGDLYLFRGQNSLHRVSEIKKGKRINVILTFNTEPNIVLNNYTLKKFFGVVRP